MLDLVSPISSQLQPLAPELFWILCVAFIIAFLLAFSVGANDVSNSFGTSVGSRVLTVTQACILATIFESAGATLLGYSVCDTIRQKLYDVDLYAGNQKELMLGALASLIGSASWNLIATALKMPISGTHSIVGASVGFSVVSKGWDSIKWNDMLRIVTSWFASPLLSGLISSLIYVIISKTIICKIDPLRDGLKALPLFYGLTIFINVASVVIDGPNVFGLNTLPWYYGLFISLVAGGVTICCVAMIMVPRIKSNIMNELLARQAPASNGLGVAAAAPVPAAIGYDNMTFKAEESQGATGGGGSGGGGGAKADKPQPPPKPRRDLSQLDAKQLEESAAHRPVVAAKPAHLRRQAAQDETQLEEVDLGRGAKAVHLEMAGGGGGGGGTLKTPTTDPFDSGERYEVARLFASLQILTASFASFAHGTNDVSNAVAPLIPIWNIYTQGLEDAHLQTPIWILAFGSIGICTGLWAWGRAVMNTVSDGITKITPSKGFSIELGAAISVLVATKLGKPISTTHCKVGSLVIVGLVSDKFLSQDHLFSRSLVGASSASSKGGSTNELIIEDDKKSSIDWRLLGGIALTWIVTVPFAALASALVMVVLRWLAL